MAILTAQQPNIDREREFMRVHPHRFALWLGLASIVMIFAGLTSAYVVRQAGGNWVDFVLPQAFAVSVGMVVLSSMSMQWAYIAFSRQQLRQYKVALAGSLILGIGFIITQYIGWQSLQDIGIYLTGNPSGAFVYVISYVHAAHVIGGLIFIAIFLVKAFLLSRNPAKDLILKADSSRKINLELITTYWHFVGLLWIYLYTFFQLR